MHRVNRFYRVYVIRPRRSKGIIEHFFLEFVVSMITGLLLLEVSFPGSLPSLSVGGQTVKSTLVNEVK